MYFLYIFIITFTNATVLYMVMWDTNIKDGIYSLTRVYTLILLLVGIVSLLLFFMCYFCTDSSNSIICNDLHYRISLIFRSTNVPFAMSKQERREFIHKTKMKKYKIWNVLSSQINLLYLWISIGAFICVLQCFIFLGILFAIRPCFFACCSTILIFCISFFALVFKVYVSKIVLNNDYFLLYCGMHHISVTAMNKDFKEALRTCKDVWVGEQFIYCNLDTYVAVFNRSEITFVKVVKRKKVFPWQKNQYSLLLESRGAKYYTQPDKNKKGLEAAFNKIFS